MSKNKKGKIQSNEKQEIKKEEIFIDEKETKEINTTQDIKEQESKEETIEKEKLAKEISKFVDEIKDFVSGYSRYNNILKINPLKDTLSKLQKSKLLDVEEKRFLARVNRTIYAKTVKYGESVDEQAPKTLTFRSLQEKVDRLSEIAEGYGDRAYITTISDTMQESFYCIKEKVVDNKTILEEALKITDVGGAFLPEGMDEEEVKKVRDTYNKLAENENENSNISIFTKEIKNDPNYAANYYSKICESRKLEAQDRNKELEQAEDETMEA